MKLTVTKKPIIVNSAKAAQAIVGRLDPPTDLPNGGKALVALLFADGEWEVRIELSLDDASSLGLGTIGTAAFVAAGPPPRITVEREKPLTVIEGGGGKH